MTPFMSAADGVASNWAVKVPVWLANAVFCQLPPWVVCAHAGAAVAVAVAVAVYIARATAAGISAAALATASVRIDIDRNLIRFPSVRGRRSLHAGSPRADSHGRLVACSVPSVRTCSRPGRETVMASGRRDFECVHIHEFCRDRDSRLRL